MTIWHRYGLFSLTIGRLNYDINRLLGFIVEQSKTLDRVLVCRTLDARPDTITGTELRIFETNPVLKLHNRK